jgi:hypothetical protein
MQESRQQEAEAIEGLTLSVSRLDTHAMYMSKLRIEETSRGELAGSERVGTPPTRCCASTRRVGTHGKHSHKLRRLR